MTATLSVVYGAADAELDGFRLGYVAEDGTQHQLSLADAWAVRFEVMSPARRYRARKGQRHLPGLWWSSTMAGHVGYESWLERDHVMWLDWDPLVVGIAAQPFWLSWTGPGGRDVAHAPDFFARRVDGSAVVVDCRPVDRRPAGDVAKFDATRRACNTSNPNRYAGYAVALPDDRNAAGDTIWYSGFTLAADLSLPNLRRRWRSP